MADDDDGPRIEHVRPDLVETVARPLMRSIVEQSDMDRAADRRAEIDGVPEVRPDEFWVIIRKNVGTDGHGRPVMRAECISGMPADLEERRMRYPAANGTSERQVMRRLHWRYVQALLACKWADHETCKRRAREAKFFKAGEA